MAVIIGGIAAGAAAGAAGGLMGGGDTTVKPEFAEEQKPLLAAAQLSAVPYAQLMAGGTPEYLRKLMAQQQGLATRTGRSQLQDYLRQIGMRGGGDFGPAATTGMANIYGGISPAVMQAVNAVRSQATQQAFKQTGQWGMISPQGSTTSTEQPSMGAQIGAGALGGLSRGLGGVGQPKPAAAASAPRAPVPNQSLPPAQQGPVAPGIQMNEGIQAAQNATKNLAFPQGMQLTGQNLSPYIPR